MRYALPLIFCPFVPGRPSWATRAEAVWIEPSITPAAASSSLGFVWTYHGEWRSECATRDRLFRGSMTRATPRNWFSETTGRSQRPATRYGDTQAVIAPTPLHTGLLADQVGLLSCHPASLRRFAGDPSTYNPMIPRSFGFRLQNPEKPSKNTGNGMVHKTVTPPLGCVGSTPGGVASSLKPRAGACYPLLNQLGY